MTIANENVKIDVKKINFNSLSIDEIKEIQKLLTEAKNTLQPKREKTEKEINISELSTDLMSEILGFNAAFNRLKKFTNFEEKQIVTSSGKIYTFKSLDIKNVQRFEYLLRNLKNVTIFYSANVRYIKPQQLLNKIVNLCAMDDSKFSSLQRARMEKK